MSLHNDVMKNRTFINSLAFILSLFLTIIFFIPSAYADLTEQCGGVFTDFDAFNGAGSGGFGTGITDPNVCGPTSGCLTKIRAFQSGADITVKLFLFCGDPFTCADIGTVDVAPADGICDGTDDDPPPPIDCSSGAGTVDSYSCSGATLEAALACQEGASTPEGCELEIPPGGTNADCTQTGVSVSQGGSGNQFTCIHDLEKTGEESDPGDGLPETDDDEPSDTVEGDVVEEEGTEGGCDFETTTKTQITNNNDGTRTRCVITTTNRSGITCLNPGSDVSEDCSTLFGDGSTTETQSDTTTDGPDGTGNITDATNSTTNTPSQTEQESEEEGNYSGSNDCGVPPTCSGDPLLCGLIQQEFESRCDFITSAGDVVFDDDSSGIDNVEVTVDSEISSVLATSGWIGNRSCPTVPAETIQGTSITWSFEGICSAFGILSYLVLAFAGFSSIRIIMGAF